MGTFGGALEARQIDASNGALTADVSGEVEAEEGVLVDPAHPRGNAPQGARTHERNRRARAQQICHALPAIPDTTQGNPAHLLIRAGNNAIGLTS